MFISIYGITSGIKDSNIDVCKSVALLNWWQTKYAAFPLAMWFSEFGMSPTIVYKKLKCNLYWFIWSLLI